MIENVPKTGFFNLNDRKHEIVDCTEHFDGCGDSGLLEEKGMKESDSKLVDPTASGGALARRNAS